MPLTSSSIRSLSRELELRLGHDGDAGLREFDRRETAAVIHHLLGLSPAGTAARRAPRRATA